MNVSDNHIYVSVKTSFLGVKEVIPLLRKPVYAYGEETFRLAEGGFSEPLW